MYTTYNVHFCHALAILLQAIFPDLAESHAPGSRLLFAVASVGEELASVDADIARFNVEIAVEKNGPAITGLVPPVRVREVAQFERIDFHQPIKSISSNCAPYKACLLIKID